MNDEINTILSRQVIRSWTYSVLLHAGLWGMAGWVLSQEATLPQHELFQWEVSLVGTSHEAEAAPSSASAAAVSRPHPAQKVMPRSMKRGLSSRDQVLVETQGIDAVMPKPEAQPVPVAEPVADQRPMPSAEPSQPVHAQGEPPMAVEAVPTQPVQREPQDYLQDQVQPAIVATPEGPRELTPVSDRPVGDVLVSAAKVSVTEPALPPSAPSGATVHGQAEVEMAHPASPVPSTLIEDVPEMSESQAAQVAPGMERTASRPALVKTDFGWLVQALWSKVAGFKRYPHEARINRWQGKVVVRVMIDEHGHLLEARIASSSGHEVLDQDAIAVITRSCPLALSQPLGQSQVVLRVPIQYRLDS